MTDPTPEPDASELTQALAGEAVLRHVAGRRVLDLGHGAPEITQWARRVASSVSVAPLAELDQDGNELRIPAADAAYDAVFCLRTLPHLGHDEDSSLAMLRSLLQEAARVTAPGGVLMLEINNFRSLRGLAHGIRHPITIVASGVVVEGEHHVTRYDSLGRLLKLAPRELELVGVYGIRVLVPISRFLALPLVGKLLAAGEWWARDSFLRHFGAHLLAILRKPDATAGRIAHP
jgi:SAM-dependent methyltransferase